MHQPKMHTANAQHSELNMARNNPFCRGWQESTESEKKHYYAATPRVIQKIPLA